jgi:predicted aconitase with swiveling domain
MVLPNVIGLAAGTAVMVKLLKEGKAAKAKK